MNNGEEADPKDVVVGINDSGGEEEEPDQPEEPEEPKSEEEI